MAPAARAASLVATMTTGRPPTSAPSATTPADGAEAVAHLEGEAADVVGGCRRAERLGDHAVRADGRRGLDECGEPVAERLRLERRDLLLGGLEARGELGDAGGELIARRLQRRRQLRDERALGRERAERVEPDERLDAAVGRADRRLADEVDETDLGARRDVRAGAELARPRAADVDHAHGVAVLLAEQRHRAEALRLVERQHPRRHLEVVAHRVVGDLLDLGLRRVRQRLTPREVEAHVAGAVERARLRRGPAERVAERRVHEVGRRVRLARGAAVRGIHDRRRGLTDADLARRDLDGVAHEARHGLLHVEDLELEARARR